MTIMSFVIKVNGETVRGCRTFKEAKLMAKIYGGKIYGTHKVKLPKAVKLSYGDSKYHKSEMYREIYSENNHGYHFTKAYHKREN